MPDTRPDQIFNEHGVCNACLSFEKNKKVDWTKRAQELENNIVSYTAPEDWYLDFLIAKEYSSKSKNSFSRNSHKLGQGLDAFSNPQSVGMTSYHKSGSTIFGSDGTNYNIVGNSIFGSDGTNYNITGNMMVSSDGSNYILSGNTIFGSDGTNYNIVGNSIMGSNGSFCSSLGSSIICH